VLARLQQRDRLRGMQGVRGRNDRGIDTGVATTSCPLATTPRAWKSWIHPHPNNATRTARH